MPTAGREGLFHDPESRLRGETSEHGNSEIWSSCSKSRHQFVATPSGRDPSTSQDALRQRRHLVRSTLGQTTEPASYANDFTVAPTNRPAR